MAREKEFEEIEGDQQGISRKWISRRNRRRERRTMKEGEQAEGEEVLRILNTAKIFALKMAQGRKFGKKK